MNQQHAADGRKQEAVGRKWRAACTVRLLPFAFCLLPSLGLIGIGGVGAWADEPSSQPVVEVKTQEGLRFTLPPDWPVEKRGGVVAPIPIEEYLARKFSVMDNRLRSLEQQTAGFDLRLRVLEEQAQERKGLRSTGAVP